MLFGRPHPKTPGELAAMCDAGRLSAKALRITGQEVRPGVSTLYLDAICEEVIREGGGTPAFKGYGGYPSSICASVNEMAVHGIPSRSQILHEGDIVSIDTGAIVDGWYGDNAWTYAVGEVAPEVQGLLDTTRTALVEGLRQVVAGNRLGDIGAAIQSVVEEAGFSLLYEYGGHGIGRTMHERPDVPNYGKPHHGMKLKVGDVLAIEPIVSAGGNRVVQLKDGWGVATVDKSPTAHFEKTVAVMPHGKTLLVSTERTGETVHCGDD